MTKDQLHELQMTMQTLDTIVQLDTDKKPEPYTDKANEALDRISELITMVQRNPSNYMDHNFWSDDLGRDVAKEAFPVNAGYNYQYQVEEKDGDFILTITMPNESDSEFTYMYYKSNSDVREDLQELRKLGITIDPKLPF